MTRKKRLWVGLAVIALFLPVVFFAGCAKKAPITNVTTSQPERKSPVQAPVRATKDDQEARERNLREQKLREQDLREQGIREQRLGDQTAGGKAPQSAKRDAGGNDVVMLKELQIPDIHFEFDKYTLNPEAQATLKAGARGYLTHSHYKLLVEGHCDERGTAEYNLALGQKRADEAAKFLIDFGIVKERIETISYGKEKPLDPGHDETALAKNRRDHFVVSQP
jgi:peptidoglycan-associated lipoprotein